MTTPLRVLDLTLVFPLVAEGFACLTSPDRRWLNPRWVKASEGFADLERLIDDVGWGPGLRGSASSFSVGKALGAST